MKNTKNTEIAYTVTVISRVAGSFEIIVGATNEFNAICAAIAKGVEMVGDDDVVTGDIRETFAA